MNYIGIDVSAETLDVAWQLNEKWQYLKLPNTRAGFRDLIRNCGKDAHFVMESTGPYYLALALNLHQQLAKVSVVNALVIKRFIQMHLEKNKNDRKDARWICRYGYSQHPEIWQAPPTHIIHSRQLQTTLLQLTKQRTACLNSLKSLKQLPAVSRVCSKSIEKVVHQLEKQIVILEKELEKILKIYEGKKMEALQSIPGIGKRTVAMLLIATDGFRKVSNHRQLSSWAGLAPREYTSGTSIRGKVRISKSGNSEIRNVLYMCSLSAIKKNKACKELYDRLKANGKSGKLALMAVCNKLIKQCVAIARTESKYDENYISKNACF